MRNPAKNPSKARDLREGEFLGPRGLPASSGSTQTLAEPLPHWESRIFDADPNMYRGMCRGISRQKA